MRLVRQLNNHRGCGNILFGINEFDIADLNQKCMKKNY